MRPSPQNLAKEAKSAFERGELEAAIEGFSSARDEYHQAGDHLLAAEMANNLSVALLQSNRSGEALHAVKGTQQLFLDAEDEFRAAMAYGNLASALEANGELQGAEEALEEAIRLFNKIGDKEHLGHSARALSQLQLRRGRPLEAVTTMQSGLEKQSKISVKNRILRSILSIPSRILGR
jgi:tetratricopeptide (TPR) repeat protein